MYVNHKNAKIIFNSLVTCESPDWIIISGGESSGKTSFIKEVCPYTQTLFCEPHLSLFYLDGFIPYFSAQWKDYVKSFLSENPLYLQKIKNMYGIDYINDISDGQLTDIIRTLIRIDMTEQMYKYANYIGNVICSKFKYIVLDSFFQCDIECYNWLLHFAEVYLKKQGYIIALCDFDKNWESTKIKEIFYDIQELIDIQYFDAESDYFSVLKDNIYFDNTEILRELSHELFSIYNGNAQLLFKTLKLYGADKDTNDYDRKKRLLRIANNLTIKSLKLNSKVDKLILELLALSPCPLSIIEISKTLEISENLIQEVLLKHYNDDLLDMKQRDNNIEVGYCIADTLIGKLIIQNIEMKSKNFILNRIWIMSKSSVLNISSKSKVELAFEIKNLEAEELLFQYLNDNIQTVAIEKKIEYIDRLYSLNLHTTHKFSNYHNAEMAYEYGYFDTALKMLLYMKKNKELDYSFFMLLGGVQHLLLRPEAPKTFEKAANLPNITVSQRLSALNREIMSLNQADAESALKARQLYDFILNQYANEKCDGLIELYRNTNNSYPANVALEFTIKGYQLATELGNELEKYKCMHNICMILLHQNRYPSLLKRPEIDIEPNFILVDKFFKKTPRYYHKRAYPLLDLGTYEMFEYISTNEKKHLRRAKSYYSKAQLFAKSFYARHIAEMSLLIVNTHLYHEQKSMVNSIRQKREHIYKKYTIESIVDYRVNRKILLSLAVSAVLTQDIEEAYMYLELVEPYVSGPETARYNNLKSICEGASLPNTGLNVYYDSPYLVPWLISLAH